MSQYPFNVKDVIRMMKEDTILTKAWMNERAVMDNPIDGRFLGQYFELMSIRLQWLEDLL